jgi:hypothetical protein
VGDGGVDLGEGGAHFAGTSAGRVLSAEDGYRFVSETRA